MTVGAAVARSGLLVALLALLPSAAGAQPVVDSLRARIEGAPPAERADLYNELGAALDGAARYAEAGDAFARAVALQENAGDSAGLAFAHHNLGLIHWRRGRYDSSRVHHERALALYDAMNVADSAAMQLNSLGVINYELSNWDDALGYYLRSLERRREIGDTRGVALVLNNIGLTYLDWGELDRAGDFFREGRERAEESGDPYALGYSLNNQGRLHEERGELERAEESYRRSLGVYREADHTGGTLLSLVSLGRLSHRMGRQDRAATFLAEALELARSTDNREDEARALMWTGLVHREEGDLATAVDRLSRALEISREIGQRTLTRDLLGHLSDVWAARGDYGQALEYGRSRAALTDSLFAQAEAMEARYQAQRMGLENRALRRSSQMQDEVIARQRLNLVLGSVLLVLTGTFAVILYRMNRSKKRANRLLMEANASLEEKNRELAETLARVRVLRGLIPICASCKKIRDDQGYWEQVETYVKRHSEADFSHGICPDCARRLYGLDVSEDEGGRR